MTEGAGRKVVSLQHAKSAWPDMPDHDRPLARRGKRDAPVMGRWLRAAGHLPDQVVCSTARRARETWLPAQAVRAKFPTTAIAVLELTGSWDKLVPESARLTRFVTPRDL